MVILVIPGLVLLLLYDMCSIYTTEIKIKG